MPFSACCNPSQTLSTHLDVAMHEPAAVQVLQCCQHAVRQLHKSSGSNSRVRKRMLVACRRARECCCAVAVACPAAVPVTSTEPAPSGDQRHTSKKYALLRGVHRWTQQPSCSHLQRPALDTDLQKDHSSVPSKISAASVQRTCDAANICTARPTAALTCRAAPSPSRCAPRLRQP